MLGERGREPCFCLHGQAAGSLYGQNTQTSRAMDRVFSLPQTPLGDIAPKLESLDELKESLSLVLTGSDKGRSPILPTEPRDQSSKVERLDLCLIAWWMLRAHRILTGINTFP